MTKNAIDEAGLRKGDIVVVDYEYKLEPPGLFIMVDNVSGLSTRALGDAGNLCDITFWYSDFSQYAFRDVVGNVSASVDAEVEKALLHLVKNIAPFFSAIPADGWGETKRDKDALQKAKDWWAKCYGEQQA